MASKSPSEYTQEEVAVWLNSIGLGSKVEAFKQNGVDGSLLVILTEDDVKSELGLTTLQARKFAHSLDFAKSLAAEGGGGGGAEILALQEENAKLKQEIERLKMINKDLYEKLSGGAPPPSYEPAPAPKPAPAPAPAHKPAGESFWHH